MSGFSRSSDDDWDVSGGGVSNSPSSVSNGSSRSDRNLNSRPRKSVVHLKTSSSARTGCEAMPTEYVDYKPVDQPDDEPDNSENFDER